MQDSLSQRGRSLEELFFRDRDARLIEQYKKLERMKQDAQNLAEVSHIKNSEVLEKLVTLGISPGILASLAVLPLVEVAWADGQLNEKEKEVVLAAVANQGMQKGSMNYDLLESWLKDRPGPTLLEAWIYYIKGLKEVLNPQEIEHLKQDLLSQAKKVAQAAGGLFSKVSPEEKAVLDKMQKAFEG